MSPNVYVRYCADEKVGISRDDASERYLEGLESLLQESGYQIARSTTSWANVGVREHRSPLVTVIHFHQYIGSPDASQRKHTNFYTVVGREASVAESIVSSLRDFAKGLDYEIVPIPEKIAD